MKKSRKAETSKPISAALGWVAVVIAISVVVARATILEGLRDPFPAMPNTEAYPRSAGPAASLILDLLCCVPALLVLLRRATGAGELGGRSWSCILLGILAAGAMGSVLWADDKFAAVVGAGQLVAAFALMWAVAQLMTTWRDFRLVAAICYGLLLVCLTRAALDKFVDLPDTQKAFEDHKEQFLKERGWLQSDFLTRQFEIKLANAEVLGFNSSANSFAAVLVMLMGVALGLAIQRWIDGELYAIPWAGITAILIPATVWILFYLQSKAAFFTVFFTPAILAVLWRGRRKLGEHSVGFYCWGVGAVVAAIASVIGFGLVFHRLPSASLNFRWRYWTAAWRMFLARPWRGVGWSNFGLHYLRYRLPVAAEEIQDPHNFFVRFLTELGILGAILALAWQARLWWELTRARQAAGETGTSPISIIGTIGVAGMMLNTLASVDFDQSGAFVLVELLKRTLFALVLIVGALAVAIRSMKEPRLDGKAAPWILYAVIASVGAFLIHNLIEFSIFETGPLMIFALLVGSALGVRRQATPIRRPVAAGWLTAAGASWVAAAVGLVIPVAVAESLAQQGDDRMRAGHLQEASDDYVQAYHHVDFNCDYIYRAALATALDGRNDRNNARKIFDQAIADNPSSVPYYLSRARLDGELGDIAAMKADYLHALELNPNEVSIHLEFGDALVHFKLADEAVGQFESALKYNNLLSADEPKRVNNGLIREGLAAALAADGKSSEAIEQYRQALADNDALAGDDPRRLSDGQVGQIHEAISRGR